MLKTIVQVLLFFFMAFVGMMGAFGLVCIVPIQLAEPKDWISFVKLLATFGGAVLIFWVWWKFNILGCTRAAERFMTRAGKKQKEWRETSVTYQIIIVIVTIATMLHMIIQSRNLRNLIHEKPSPMPQKNSGISTNTAIAR